MQRLMSALLTVLCLLAATVSVAATINVPADYAQIHDAVQAASAGDVVLVASGTYTDCTHETEGPGTTLACVVMKSGVILRGSGQGNTIIDAQSLGRGIFAEGLTGGAIENIQVRNAYAAVFGAGILIRDVPRGFEITDVTVQDCTDGGIILINGAHATLRNVSALNNEAKQGGGMAIEEGSHPLVLNCTIMGNQAPSGAGIFIRANSDAILSGCSITGNDINSPFGQGAGIFIGESSPIISNCDISSNDSRGNGGGVAYQLGSGGRLENCTITNNAVIDDYMYGAGVAVDSSDPVIEGCLIASNSCVGVASDGAGVSTIFSPAPTFTRCTITGNTTSAGGSAGGAFVQFFSNPIFDKCIISSATVGAAMVCSSGTPTVQCSNVWGNDGGDALCGTDGGGNISLDPQFCGPGDYRLGSGSPCLNVCGEAIGAYPVGCTNTGVGDTPSAVQLLGNYPNPFNPATTIVFSLDVSTEASVRIADVSGRIVTTLTLGKLPAGRHEAVWNGRNDAGHPVASGVYLYELQALGTSHTRRMILVK